MAKAKYQRMRLKPAARISFTVSDVTGKGLDF
jgi:hypothetical protein